MRLACPEPQATMTVTPQQWSAAALLALQTVLYVARTASQPCTPVTGTGLHCHCCPGRVHVAATVALPSPRWSLPSWLLWSTSSWIKICSDWIYLNLSHVPLHSNLQLRLWSQIPWVQILALPITCYVTITKLLSVCALVFSSVSIW